MRIQFSEPARLGTKKQIFENLLAHSREHFDDLKVVEFSVEVFSDSNKMIAGGAFNVSGGMMVLEMLWVAEDHRNQGLGTKVITEIEECAQRLGATKVVTDTFNFQAPEFYQKLGYQVFGAVGYPNGSERFYLTKTLGAGYSGNT